MTVYSYLSIYVVVYSYFAKFIWLNTAILPKYLAVYRVSKLFLSSLFSLGVCRFKSDIDRTFENHAAYSPIGHHVLNV